MMLIYSLAAFRVSWKQSERCWEGFMRSGEIRLAINLGVLKFCTQSQGKEYDENQRLGDWSFQDERAGMNVI